MSGEAKGGEGGRGRKAGDVLDAHVDSGGKALIFFAGMVWGCGIVCLGGRAAHVGQERVYNMGWAGVGCVGGGGGTSERGMCWMPILTQATRSSSSTLSPFSAMSRLQIGCCSHQWDSHLLVRDGDPEAGHSNASTAYRQPQHFGFLSVGGFLGFMV